MSARRKRRNGGFTLIELLIAAALSTVGLLGLIALQTVAIRGNMMSRNFGEAIGIAQQRIEMAERTPYATLTAMLPLEACPTNGSVGGTANVSPTADVSSKQAIYTRCTDVTINADNTTTITVNVWWADLNPVASAHKVTLMTRRSP